MLLHNLAGFISGLLDAYTWVILVSALITWVLPSYHPVVRVLRQVTEPVLRPIRERLPTNQTGIDFSPLVAILAIQFIARVVLPSLL